MGAAADSKMERIARVGEKKYERNRPQAVKEIEINLARDTKYGLGRIPINESIFA